MATLAAVVVTALMMWFLDRFSPYSARNNREKYGPNARIFTLKESFWYAITQITPEGKILFSFNSSLLIRIKDVSFHNHIAPI